MQTTTERVNPHNGVRVNASTLYELAAEHPDGRRILIAYCYRKTRGGIYKALQGRIEHIERVLGTLEFSWQKRAREGLTMGAWRIFWTGRTQRDAESGRALPFVANL